MINKNLSLSEVSPFTLSLSLVGDLLDLGAFSVTFKASVEGSEIISQPLDFVSDYYGKDSWVLTANDTTQKTLDNYRETDCLDMDYGIFITIAPSLVDSVGRTYKVIRGKITT